MFINDIVYCSDKCKFIPFADDTNVMFQGRDILNIQDTVNTELVKLSNWIKSNEFILNHSKSHYMITTPHIKFIHDIDIIMDNVSLKKINEIKCLSVIVDSQVNFKSHISDGL